MFYSWEVGCSRVVTPCVCACVFRSSIGITSITFLGLFFSLVGGLGVPHTYFDLGIRVFHPLDVVFPHLYSPHPLFGSGTVFVCLYTDVVSGWQGLVFSWVCL